MESKVGIEKATACAVYMGAMDGTIVDIIVVQVVHVMSLVTLTEKRGCGGQWRVR